MGQLNLHEQAAPATPNEGVSFYPTIATPSIAKVKDDAGGDYSLALLEKAQTISAAKTFLLASTSTIPLTIDTPSGQTVQAQKWSYNGAQRAYIILTSTFAQLGLDAADFGAGGGPSIIADRNNNASTPAAGNLRITDRGATEYYIWPDDTGVLRIGTAVPTSANDTSGTIVGSQSSMAEAKLISDDLSELGEVMARLRAGAAAVRRFTYRSGAYGGQEFEGLVTNYAPAYGADRDEAHPHGKSLNIIQVVGDLLRTVDWLVNKVIDLEAKLDGRS